MPEIHKQALAEKDLLGIWDYTFKKWGTAQADTYLDRFTVEITEVTIKPRPRPANILPTKAKADS